MPEIRISLVSDRNRAGHLSLVDETGAVLVGPYSVCGRANDFAASDHANPFRSTLLPYGDTPTGEYRVRGIVPTGAGTAYDAEKFGRAGMIVLEPVSGPALLADRNGRHVVLVQAGTPRPESRLLYATNGSVRMYDNDLRKLIAGIRGEQIVTCSIDEIAEYVTDARITIDPHYDEGDPPLVSSEVMSGGAKLIVCATSHTSGVRHRYRVLQQVRAFAQRSGHSMRMLWGVTPGVSDFRHEELFDPIPGVEIENVSADELSRLSRHSRSGKVIHKSETLLALRPTEAPIDRFFSWDCETAEALGRRVPLPITPLTATLCPSLRAQADSYGKEIAIQDRLGIRVRVTESLREQRQPHRVRCELDATLATLYRIDPRVPVFIATDSEYIQLGLMAHFSDARILPKRFEQLEETGRYIHRMDRQAMFTFLKEVACLCSCRQVISVGGFLNDGGVHSKIIREPYPKTVALYR